MGILKVNCHIDPNIEEEHLDLFVREMNPQISNLLKILQVPNQYYGVMTQIKSSLLNSLTSLN